MIRHIARALQALHEKNILHLDVKPENVIYLTKDPQSDMKLADFGCCLVTDMMDMDKEIVGTAGYIAPEVLTVMLHIRGIMCRVAPIRRSVTSTHWAS